MVIYKSRLVRALWIEINGSDERDLAGQSRLVRALWIEML